MNDENIIVYFTALVAVGVIVIGILTALFHDHVACVIVIIGLVLAILAFLSQGKFAHKIESLEKICFALTLLAIICSFIFLYKPM